MTVNELVGNLFQFPPNADVIIYSSDNQFGSFIKKIYFDTNLNEIHLDI